MHSVLASSAIRDPSKDAGSPSEDAGLLSVIPLDVRDPLGPCWPRLALVGPHLTSLRGLMDPPGSFSRESVREPSNYEKVDRFTRFRGPKLEAVLTLELLVLSYLTRNPVHRRTSFRGGHKPRRGFDGETIYLEARQTSSTVSWISDSILGTICSTQAWTIDSAKL